VAKRFEGVMMSLVEQEIEPARDLKIAVSA